LIFVFSQAGGEGTFPRSDGSHGKRFFQLFPLYVVDCSGFAVFTRCRETYLPKEVTTLSLSPRFFVGPPCCNFSHPGYLELASPCPDRRSFFMVVPHPDLRVLDSLREVGGPLRGFLFLKVFSGVSHLIVYPATRWLGDLPLHERRSRDSDIAYDPFVSVP